MWGVPHQRFFNLAFNDPDDGIDYISVAEVLEVEQRGSEDETVVVWVGPL